MKLVIVSSMAAVIQVVILIGWVSLGWQVGRVRVSFISVDPPFTQIVFFASLFALPTSMVTPLSMLTHWKPGLVLFKSQQITDSLRGQFAIPFRMKYLYAVQAVVNVIGFATVFKYDFFWPAALNMINICLYLLGLVLVVKHFQNPLVPVDLASTAGSVMGSLPDT